MANDNVSEWTDAEVYERCAMVLGIDSTKAATDGPAVFSRRVLDAMVEREWVVEISNRWQSCKWRAGFRRCGGKKSEAMSTSLGRAICEAAIRALKQEQGGE